MLQHLNSLNNRYGDVCDTKSKMERKFIEKLEGLERAYNDSLHSTESIYEQKLAIEDEKYRKLEREKSKIKNEYEHLMQNILG